MSNLKEIVLEEARQNIATLNGVVDFEALIQKHLLNGDIHHASGAMSVANEKALDRLDAFYRWSSLSSWSLIEWANHPEEETPDLAWINHETGAGPLHDSQIYELFKQQEKGAAK